MDLQNTSWINLTQDSARKALMVITKVALVAQMERTPVE